MKKYFLFDDEPISGVNYVRRMLVGYFLIIILIGFWITAATAYKRAGALGWKKEVRIIVAILIPILTISKALGKTKGYSDLPINLFDIFALIALVFHIILYWSNGNKVPENVKEEIIEINDINGFGLEKIVITEKYFANKLHFKLDAALTNSFTRFNLKNNSTCYLNFLDNNNNEICSITLPREIFKVNNNKFIKNRKWSYESYLQISEEKFSRISTFSLTPLIPR